MKKTIWILLVWMMVLSFSIPILAVERINIQGSTTVLPIMQIIAEEFMINHPDVDITVSGGGSGVGIAALMDKIADIAMSSRKIKEKEFEKAVSRGLDVQEFEIAKDAIAIVINPANNTLDRIDSETLKKIYTGEIKNWRDLGGEDRVIVVVSRDTNSGTFEVFNEHVLKGSELAPEVLLLASNRAVLDEISKNTDAIGYIGLGYLSDQVKALTLDGIEPTHDNALNGSYPISRGLFLYAARLPQGAEKQLIDFVLSEEGQAIVEDEGFVKIK